MIEAVVVVWVLVIGGDGKAVVPFEYTSKEECIGAGMAISNGVYTNGGAINGYGFYCVPSKAVK